VSCVSALLLALVLRAIRPTGRTHGWRSVGPPRLDIATSKGVFSLAIDLSYRFAWVPSYNSSHVSKRHDAKRQRGVGARGKPPNLGVAMNAVKSGGHPPRSARLASMLPSASLTAKSKGSQSEPPTEHPTPGLPPSRTSVRFRGAADERERGPRGAPFAGGHEAKALPLANCHRVWHNRDSFFKIGDRRPLIVL
jgi:hypothetical protein